MTSPRIATRHNPTPFPLLIRCFLPRSARPSPRRALTTSPPASSSRSPFVIHKYSHGSISTTPTCPPSACACADTPSGLNIDHERPLNGTMPPYVQHVVVRTGRDDWGSRIEEEDESVKNTGVNFARSLKELVGSGGRFHDPERPILITNSSLPEKPSPKYTSVHVFPQHLQVPEIANTPEGYEAFVRKYILPRSQQQGKGDVRESKIGYDATGVSKPEEDPLAPAATLKPAYVINTSPTILICGHNSRDTRCGILGPLLRAEFNSYIRGGNWLLAADERRTDCSFREGKLVHPFRGSRVALISHIGGHAFAGNVIIYIPKKSKTINGGLSTLAGKGIWYGRVEPRHVWGIMEKAARGIVIRELLRGIFDPDPVISGRES